MKYIRVTFIALLFVAFFIVSWYVFVEIFTNINPNYIILENGKRGYVMNTENLLYGLLTSISITLITIKLTLTKLKRIINGQV